MYQANNNTNTPLWIVVPAGGTSQRFGSPKLLKMVAGKPLLQWTLERLLALPLDIAGIVLVYPETLAKEFKVFEQLSEKLRSVSGGRTRAESVHCGLKAIPTPHPTWVMVHDAARPHFNAEDVAGLWCHTQNHTVGGVLCRPMTSSIKKRLENNEVYSLSRDSVVEVLTPQVFKYDLLDKALAAYALDPTVTDEASCVEKLGLLCTSYMTQRVVPKLTYEYELDWLEYCLQKQDA